MSLWFDRPPLFRAAILLLAGGAAGLGGNALRPSGVPLVGFNAPTACTAAATDSAPVVEMTPLQASYLCGSPGVVLADTRPAARFAGGHVAGAVHVPCDATARGVEVALRTLDAAQTIIVYGDSSDDGHAVAETLRRRGFRGDLRVLAGGFAAWEDAGLACASGACHDCNISSAKDPTP